MDMRPPFKMPVMQPMWYYWCRAKFYDTEKCVMRQAFSGWWPTEREARDWAIRTYSTQPASEYYIVKSRSRDRNVARNEQRNTMVESNEANVAEVLGTRFADDNRSA